MSVSPDVDGFVQYPESDSKAWLSAEVELHGIHLRRWLRARFPGLPDSEDLVQESLLRLLKVHAIRPIENVRAFLFVTARNLALNSLRDRRHTHPHQGEEIDTTEVVDDRSNVAETVARYQELEILQEALRDLPARCREVFTLRRIHGLSQREIAAKLGISEKTVENQSVMALHRCVAFFRQKRALDKNDVKDMARRGPNAP